MVTAAERNGPSNIVSISRYSLFQVLVPRVVVSYSSDFLVGLGLVSILTHKLFLKPSQFDLQSSLLGLEDLRRFETLHLKDSWAYSAVFQKIIGTWHTNPRAPTLMVNSKNNIATRRRAPAASRVNRVERAEN